MKICIKTSILMSVAMTYLSLICLQAQLPASHRGVTDTTAGKVELIRNWIPPMAANPHPDAQWFHEAAFGLFLHWGIVSGTPNGQAWDMRVFSTADRKSWSNLGQISPEKMFERANIFNPTNYNPDHWMKAASAAGFRYAVLTTRHHDAYFLGDSKFGEWNAGHYIGRDLIKPYVEACRSNNIKVGFYWSGPDWYHGREYMNYNASLSNDPSFYNWKHEKVDFIPPMPDSVKNEIRTIALGQIHELLTNYEKVDLLWTDGIMEGFTQAELRRLQPGAIWGRRGEYATPEGWTQMKMEYIKEANKLGYPWELCDVGNGGSWHWSEKAEQKGISAAQLITNLAKVRARGGNYLINIAPRPDGEMPHWFYPLCDKLAAWMKTGAEAIYNINTSGPFPYPDQCSQPVTVSSNTWYVFPNANPETFNQPIVIQDVENPTSVTLLSNNVKIPFEFADRTLTFRIPANQRTDMPDVVKIKWTNKYSTIHFAKKPA